MNLFLFGLLPDETLRERTLKHIPFAQTLDPLKRLDMYYSYQKQVQLDNPDIVVIGTGLWEMMHFTRLHILNQNQSNSNPDVLHPDLLFKWAHYYQHLFIPKIKSLYPYSKLYIRTIPSTPQHLKVTHNWGIHDLMIKTGKPYSKSKMFRSVYVDAFNRIMKFIIRRHFPEIDILDWHKVTLGNLKWVDDVHPDGNGYKDFMNMILFELEYNITT